MKTKYKVIIGVVVVLWILAFFTNDKDTDVADVESTQTEINTQQETEPLTEPETQLNVDDLTEEEYKAMCEEVYDESTHDNDAPSLEEKLEVGQLVKIDGSISFKYKDLQVGVFGEWENRLESYYFKCGVLNTGYSEPNLPVYGELIYLVFDKQGNLSADDFETGQEVVLYGEVVLEWDGVYVVPKYMEIVEY